MSKYIINKDSLRSIRHIVTFKFENRPKIFCIGRNKTGTTSMMHVMKEFGYKLGDQGKAELHVKNYAKGNWKPIIDYCKTAEAFQDAPFSWPYTWLILHEHFPGAKFILTIRNSEEWYRSIIGFHSNRFADGKRVPLKTDLMNGDYRYKGFIWDANRAVWKTDEENVYDKNAMISNFERHNRDVQHFFKDKQNFIEIDVSKKGSYRKICAFLDKTPIHKEFPHKNKT